MYEVDCSNITVKAGADVDIGMSCDLYTRRLLISSLGANASTEEGEEALEEGAITVNNVVYSFRLQSTSFDKKSFLTYLKVPSDLFVLIIPVSLMLLL